jgi:hypothetical protein
VTFTPPCARPENNPDDWFIGRDGKQYPDDEILSPERVAEIREAISDNAEHYTDPVAAADAAVDRAEERALRHNLAKRRHARDKCHLDCLLRLHCLGQGLEVSHGTFGGYYEEERRQIVALRNERESRRRGEGDQE